MVQKKDQNYSIKRPMRKKKRVYTDHGW